MKIKNLILCLLFITACSTKMEEVHVMYEKSIQALQEQKYNTAAKLLEKMDEEYPYTTYANNVNVLLAYTYYKQKQYSSVIPVVDIYVKTNPRSSDIPYMLYLKALTYYNQISSYKKDREILLEFKKIVDTLSYNFPNSVYTQDLKNKSVFVMNILYLSELHIGLQYQQNKNCPAAISRYLSLLKLENEYVGIVRQNYDFCLNYLKIK